METNKLGTSIKIKETVKNSKVNTFFGCTIFLLVIAVGVGLVALFFIGPLLFKDYFIKTDEAIAFSTQYDASILVMIFIIFWFFPCLYWVKGAKRFLLSMIVPFIAYGLLFFNYHLVTYEGVRAAPYFQVIPEFIKWEDMEEVAFIPNYRVGRRDTTFEISIVYLDQGKSTWVDTNNDLENLHKLKEMLANQGEVPVFIYPLDEGDVNRLGDIRKDNKEYYEEILQFLEIKDIDSYDAEHILVNEAFY